MIAEAKANAQNTAKRVCDFSFLWFSFKQIRLGRGFFSVLWLFWFYRVGCIQNKAIFNAKTCVVFSSKYVTLFTKNGDRDRKNRVRSGIMHERDCCAPRCIFIPETSQNFSTWKKKHTNQGINIDSGAHAFEFDLSLFGYA